ncbi:MAG: glutamate-1-semialdehyde 2,1-aminomutase [Ignavibacteriae bacterium]|nr:glutamate-1-semialdehyde 2,1-aminomutase [Ignavibacteriota bacterium]MCB9215966.1 glutamate-1-semialdehyde 2,1-aminomutase [Ignavibacteria bacterium]
MTKTDRSGTVTTSRNLFSRAQQVIPGGVNSPARAFGGVGGEPIFFASAKGCRMTDVDGNHYIDYVGSWGPFILGHGDERVLRSLRSQLELATSFGAPSEAEVEIAELLTTLIPGLDMVRLVSSGTEATMSAVRVARGYTGRNRIIKFEGCYHGHGDSFLIKAGSGLLTLGEPSSPGVTPGTAADTLVAEFNNIDSVRRLFAEHRSEIAAVIIEPIGGNMGVVPSTPEFLSALRELCSAEGSLLIFDEVMTGFRVALKGAASIYNVIPDMYTYGKIIGGGLPVGAYGGKKEIMESVSPVGSVYQAGTLSGNPMAVSAGLATLRALVEDDPYPSLEEKGGRIESELERMIENYNLPGVINRVGSMFTLFFTREPVQNYAGAVASDTTLFSSFFHGMLNRGIYLPPSQFEAWFLSAAHADHEIQTTLEAADSVLSDLARL